MTPKRLQHLSVIGLLLSVVVELTAEPLGDLWGNPELHWGISLGLVLASLSFNIKVIREFGIPQKQRKQSQRLAFITAVYAFLVFALEVI